MRKRIQSNPTRFAAMRAALLAGAALAALAVATPAFACDTNCGAGFSISVDGESVAGDPTLVDSTVPPADIQVKYDGLEVRPALNVSTVDLRRSYRAGEAVGFLASLNYPAWVARKEVRIYAGGKHASAKPVAVLPVDESGHAAWAMPADGPDEYLYVVRVSDDRNRYDETVPLPLVRSAEALKVHAEETPVAPGYGEDRTAVRNIPVYGGAVTIHGAHVPAGEQVVALGETIPVDAQGGFVVQRILPPGDHAVDVSVSGGGGAGMNFSRTVNIPTNEWFYVGLADITAGKRFGRGDIEAADPSAYDGVYTKGRLAFYLKGKIKGRTLLTAAADTGEGRIEDLFKGFDAKDPRQVLRRIDPDSYYPVYGDDSTAVESAPSDGKFYVRLDRGDSHVMWGRYKADVNGSTLLRNERALYGARGVYRSQESTSFGERRYQAKAYASQPGTLPQRDVLRGTGGSAYFLKRQDVSRGTETITVVTSDASTGRIVSRKQLIAGEDYDINYVQGVVVLKRPLHSSADDGGVVRDGALGNRNVDLVASYEYTPAAGRIDDYAYGGEASGWLGEHVRVGITGMSEQTGAADQKMGGVNLRLSATDSTYIDGEFATTAGPGFGRTLSTDGGLTSVDELTAGSRSLTGQAWSLRGEVDLADLDPTLKGRVSAFWDEKRAGFASLDANIAVDQRNAGLSATYEVAPGTELRAAVEDYADASGRRKRDASLEAERRLNDAWAIAAGVTHTDLATPGGPAGDNASRVDVGVRVTHDADEDTRTYMFGQATAQRRGGIDRNDRVGVGGRRKLTDKVGIEAEASYGTSGIGALAALTYDPTADDHYYVGYRLDPDAIRATALDGRNLGGVVVGAKRRYNDMLSGYAENNYDMFGRRRSLTSTYGIIYTPDKLWTLNGGLETGRILDPNASDFDRKAVSLSAGYKDDDSIAASIKGELRFEDSDDDTRDRNSYLMASTVSVKMSEDWRLVGGIDAVISKSDQSVLLDGDYVEGTAGFAYRPVAHDRLQALAKYQFLYDLPGAGQVTANGLTLGPAQRSHVVSIDANYDLTKWLTVGGKYGMRFGEVSVTRAASDFVMSSAQLAVLRADVTFASRWDALVEGRMLTTGATKTARYGALAAVYHHIGEHVKVGAGYSFASFSDDLTDLTYDDQGAFLNAVGKF
ncbi:MAG: TonB-dependent receptor [Rhizobiaceae bacterium]